MRKVAGVMGLVFWVIAIGLACAYLVGGCIHPWGHDYLGRTNGTYKIRTSGEQSEGIGRLSDKGDGVDGDFTTAQGREIPCGGTGPGNCGG